MDSGSIQKKIAYLIMFMECFVEDELYNILSDDINDLHHSVVAVNNLIICMRDVEGWLRGSSNYYDLKTFLEDHLFTEDEIGLILQRYAEESEIYYGEQF